MSVRTQEKKQRNIKYAFLLSPNFIVKKYAQLWKLLQRKRKKTAKAEQYL